MASRLSHPLLSAAAAAAQGAVALAIWKFGHTGPIPMHFGWNGDVDRWGDRSEAALMAGAMALLSLVAGPVLQAVSQRKGGDERSYSATVMVLLLVTSLITALAAAMGFALIPADQIGGKAVMAMIGAIFAIVGAYLGKVGPNPLIGVRTPWTFASRLAWDKSNRLAGRLFLLVGFAGLVAAPLAPQPAGFQALIVAVLLIAVAVVFESWRVWRSDTDRKSAF